MKQESGKAWHDPHTGSVGYGKKYGERSFNNKPIGAVEIDLEELLQDFNPNNPQKRAMREAWLNATATSQ